MGSESATPIKEIAPSVKSVQEPSAVTTIFGVPPVVGFTLYHISVLSSIASSELTKKVNASLLWVTLCIILSVSEESVI